MYKLKIKQHLNNLNKNVPNKTSFLTEGIILFVLPIIAYMSSFAYELGYATYFNFPEEVKQLISVNLLSRESFIIVLSTYFIIAIPFCFHYFKPINFGNILLAFFIVFILLGFLFKITISVYPISLYSATYHFIVIIFFLMPIILSILFWTSTGNKIISRIQNTHNINKLFFVFLGIMITIVLFYDKGKTDAANQTTFSTYEANTVILKQYGDTIISVPLASASTKYKPIYIVRKIGVSSISIQAASTVSEPLHKEQ